ncbi:hypothetical protein M5D96_007324, partial [Drosophila gunungcola]
MPTRMRNESIAINQTQTQTHSQNQNQVNLWWPRQRPKIIGDTGRRLSSIAKQIDNEGSAELTNVSNGTEQENKENLWSSPPTRAKGDQAAPTPGNRPYMAKNMFLGSEMSPSLRCKLLTEIIIGS